LRKDDVQEYLSRFLSKSLAAILENNMQRISAHKLSNNQLNYAVGLALVKQGTYTMDPGHAGFVSTLSEGAKNSFVSSFPQLQVVENPLPFLKDVDGVLMYCGFGKWQVGIINAFTGLPVITHSQATKFLPAEKWSQGGPIFENFSNQTIRNVSVYKSTAPAFRPPYAEFIKGHVQVWFGAYAGFGETLLIAAMRAFVARVLGDHSEEQTDVLYPNGFPYDWDFIELPDNVK
jgi:hypothetical protein